MQRIFEILSALVPAMPIENSENLNLGPVGHFVCFFLGLDHIENDCNSIFITFAHSANISVGGKRPNTAEGLAASF